MLRSLVVLAFYATLASAQQKYTQKPEVAPSIVAGETPKPPVAVDTKALVGGPTPLWVWGADVNKSYFLRKEFAATGVTAARLKVSADNHVVLFLNGKQVAASDEWTQPAEADVSKLLKPEGNVLVAQVRNAGGQAGFVLKLAMTTDKGESKFIVSDQTWTASDKKDDANGVAVKKVATYGDQPWGTIFDGVVAGPGSKVPTNTFVTLPGYQVTKLFSVPRYPNRGTWYHRFVAAKHDLGSWVSL
ncbi:MAG TPA: heme-binding protein, partial [Gemmataceae bacterium]|nr:heme-binding protein [Gemmataceae bacterium]